MQVVLLKRRHLDYALAGLLLLLPVVILRSSLREPTSQNGFDRAVLRISSPLQAAASWGVGGAGGLFTDYVWLVDVEDENDELRAVNLQLREELIQLRGAAAELEILEELVDLRRSTQAETAAAHVIASSINSHFRVNRVRIDRGDTQVEVGMPVISAQGLVGRILHSYGSHSDVLLISDPQSAVDVVIEETGGRGLLKGVASDDSYFCEIEYLEQGKAVEVGDKVMSSGLGKHFPEGLLVGVIASVDSARHGLYQKVTVKPAVDFSSLDSVLVLLAPPPPADPGRANDRQSKAAHGVEPF
ncbi:MAG: rod shape-determining protein MreC [Myxococcales bacterium]|nr:rod shape-determining protein MreC [Myxococcales bacterium]